jgi:hypothetical protein
LEEAGFSVFKVEGKMEKTSFIEDLREVKENWHDPEFRRDFLTGFASTFIPRFLMWFVVGLLVTAIIILAT